MSVLPRNTRKQHQKSDFKTFQVLKIHTIFLFVFLFCLILVWVWFTPGCVLSELTTYSALGNHSRQSLGNHIGCQTQVSLVYSKWPTCCTIARVHILAFKSELHPTALRSPSTTHWCPACHISQVVGFQAQKCDIQGLGQAGLHPTPEGELWV